MCSSLCFVCDVTSELEILRRQSLFYTGVDRRTSQKEHIGHSILGTKRETMQPGKHLVEKTKDETEKGSCFFLCVAGRKFLFVNFSAFTPRLCETNVPLSTCHVER